ncbi:DNA repair protein rad9 [Anaeramoeba flamelloides]|uniref:DNA repair protein rad9 n=1 Tax=Anaeramoeba flamelloides TaxID=1746091 RepID=A0ABQ8XBN8_9EUKA|nr:DNA repair protein rad9 [Anaeramoeba flamelloides]
MQASITAQSIRTFHKLLQCCSKIGDELRFEIVDETLIIRTFDSSRSAFIVFFFDKGFFESYQILTEENITFKTGLKNLLTVFKKSNTFERVQFNVDPESNNLVLAINLRFGFRKIHQIPYDECDLVHAKYTVEHFPHRVACRSKLLVDCLSKFQQSLNELTFSFTPDSMTLKTYDLDPQKAIRNKKLKTEISIKKEDIERFYLGETFINCDLTFTIKEFRAVLSFCEFVRQPINIFFDWEGKPLMCCFKVPNELRVDFVLSTFVNPNLQRESQSGMSSMQTDSEDYSSQNDYSQSEPQSQSQSQSQFQSQPLSQSQSQSQSQPLSQETQSQSQELQEDFLQNSNNGEETNFLSGLTKDKDDLSRKRKHKEDKLTRDNNSNLD